MSGNHPFGKLSVLDVKTWESDKNMTCAKARVPVELAISALQAMREFNSELSEPEKVDVELEILKDNRSTMYFYGKNFDIVKDSMKYTDERLRAEQ